MQDIFRKYQKKKVLTNLGILGLSLVFALSINFFVLSGSTGEKLKASVLETSGVTTQPDITVETQGNMLTLIQTRPLQQVQELSFSLAYDPTQLTLSDITETSPDKTILTAENEPGLTTYIITYSSPQDFEKNSEIFQVPYEKTVSTEPGYINIINANFIDVAGQNYLLSAQGAVF